MDVRFTNVLEGARQYFQGLPTGTNSMVSHAYPSEGHQQSDVDQAREPPPSSSSYWPPQATEPSQQPASHESEYAQNATMDPGRVHYPGPGPYQDQYHQQQQQQLQQQQSQQQSFQFPRPHSREAPSNNQSQYQSHIPSNSPYLHQNPTPSAKPQPSGAQYQPLTSPYHKSSPSTVKTPTGGAQYQSHMSSSYQQSPSPTIKPLPSTTQYQSHIPANTPYHQSPSPSSKPPSSSAQYQYHQVPSPYHQSPSPFHQVPSPQLPRVPSREQLIPRAPSNEQNLYRTSSQEQLAPRVPSREQQTTHYPQTSETYNNYPQARSYYPVQSQAKTMPTNNSYKTVTSTQSYPTTSQQHNTYYKHIYSSQAQTSHQTVYSNTKSSNTQQLQEIHHQTAIRSDSSEQVFRTTHNLPPIAAISNYHSSRTVREPTRPVSTTSRTRTFSSSSYTSNNNPTMVSSNSSIIQHTPVRSPYTQTSTASACYQDQTSYGSQQQQQQQQYQYTTTTATTQSYNQMIMTSSNSASNYYSVPNQNQSSSQQYYQQPSKSNTQVVPRSQSTANQQPPPSQNPADHNLNGRLVVKRESPLDLSVKTVRTPADSTLGDAENEARNKLYQTSRPVHSSISTHNYPQLDVNSFQRSLSQRASQLPSATAPKVEFRPNFNVPSLNQPLRQPPPRRPVEEIRRNVSPEKAHSNSRPVYDTKNASFQNLSPGRYSNVNIPSAAHINSYGQSQQAPPKVLMNNVPKMPLSNSSSSYTNAMYAVPPTEVQKKRPADICPPIIPNKLPKVDNWRHNIDLQIEERLSSYKQQQAKVTLSPNAPKSINGAYTSMNSDRSKDMYPPYQKASYENVTQHPSFSLQNQYQTHPNHNQTYVPSPATHQYPGYTGYPTHHSHPGNSYLQPSSRSNSSSSLNTLTNTKNNLGGAVDKRVLSLLKNSLEVKGRKKLEQQKTHENFTQHPRLDVQHPSTDVTAPLQPKPGLIGRNNVSPFTPTSFPDNSNMYKFHIPKAIDSVNFENNKTVNPILDKQTLDTVITNHSSLNPDYDGLAAFLAARIRTKGELKQGGSTNQNMSNNNTATEGHLRSIIENQLKSPTRQEITLQNSSSSGTTSSGTPPKLQKDRQAAVAPRKRLFSRNEDDVNNTHLPSRDKSGLRSSSETSVFDFPDSDSENDISGRESLEAMRKGRRSSKQGTTPAIDLKVESSPRPISPDDDIFAKLCDNFVEELKNNPVKKKCKKKKGMEAEVLAKLETVTKENPIETEKEIIFKEEITEPIKVKEEEELKEVSKVEELPEVCEIKQEPEDIFAVEIKSVLPEKELIIEEELQSNTLNKIKDKDPVFIEKQQNAKRRLVSSSDSDSDAEIKTKNVEQESKPAPSQNKPVESEVQETDKSENKELESPQKQKDAPMAGPAKKPPFGDGSDFYPGWEEGVYKYKKALRMPPSLIQVSRPPQFHRLSTSLPDLDPYPQSPTTSIVADTDKESSSKSKFKKIKSENLDSDNESNSSFNLFNRRTNYDSEGSASVRSLPNTATEMSILDRLLEKCGGKKKRKYKRKDDHSPKIIPKAESAIELLPTPSLEIKEEQDKEVKKKSSPVIKSESALLGFRKKTINNFKDAFIKSANNIVGINEQFTTVVLKSRTRKETRVLKQRATIKEVFGEDRPASAPPVTCVNDIQIKDDLSEDSNRLGNLVIKLEKTDNIIDKVIESQKEVLIEKENELADTKQMLKNKLLSKGKKKENNLLKTLVDKKIKIEIQDEIEDDTRSLEDIVIKRDPHDKSETPSIDGDDGSISGRRRNKFGKMRRKLSSGFDYIRKKKKVKKENTENENTEKKKKKIVVTKTPESIDDIQKEIKLWVLNKGIGESHLHRAARLGYTDVMAYCLENMKSNPSPKDNAGYTPLHVACSRGHLEIAKLLLLYGANPSESAQGGIRPLHEAVENGFVEVTRLLLSYGADPTLATYSGLTPLALTNDEVTKQFLKNHLNDIEGEPSDAWQTYGPSTIFDPVNQIGFNILDKSPDPDPPSEEEDIDFEVSENLLPNLYTLQGEPPADRFVLLQELSNILKIKSRDALLRQICPPSTSSAVVNYKSILRELKMTDFLEQAHCCQFLNAGEKINTRASKIALVRYTDKVKELLGVENVLITNR